MRSSSAMWILVWFLSSTSCSLVKDQVEDPGEQAKQVEGAQEEWLDFGLYVNGKAVFGLDEAGIEQIRDELAKDKDLAERKDELGGFVAYTYGQIIAALRSESASRTVYKGRIRTFAFQPQPNPGGTRPGHIVIEVRKTDEQGNVELMRWHVRVSDFNVVMRVGTPDNHTDDVFPGTILLPPDRLDPDKEDNIWDRGLDHKLFAKGPVITVLGVWQKINDQPALRLDDSHSYYRTDSQSCVDMMFAGPPPDWTLPPQPAYCLGRCPVSGGVVLVNSR